MANSAKSRSHNETTRSLSVLDPCSKPIGSVVAMTNANTCTRNGCRNSLAIRLAAMPQPTSANHCTVVAKRSPSERIWKCRMFHPDKGG